MTTALEHALLSVPVAQWRPRRTEALDWYDGPREGLCQLSWPDTEFYFTLLAERFNPEGLDDRLMAVHRLPPGGGEALLQALALPDEPEGRREVERILASAEPTNLVVLTRDAETFLGCWRRPPGEPQGPSWFEVLGL